MPGESGARLDFRGLLEAAENAPPVEALDVVAERLAGMLGATDVSFLIADFSGRAVVRFVLAGTAAAEDMRWQGSEGAERVPLADTAHGRVLRTQQTDVARKGEGARLIAPVTDRGDAIGLLELELPRYPDEATVAEVNTAAHALAFLVIANRRYTDLFEWAQRATPLSLAAEIQRRLLPESFTCEAGQLTVAGWQEPSATVGGDTFDYALDRETLHLSISDAVGHAVEAATLATVLVGSLRNGRRRGVELREQARAANEDLTAHTSAGRFVTGQLMRLDLDSGAATIVNAGHPLPLRLRNGDVEEVALDIDMPFGIRPGREFRLQKLPLTPGDRIAFITDGLVEHNAARLDVSTALRDSADLHPREVVQAMCGAVLRVIGGRLRDDATVLCLDWYGGPRRPRETSGGASRRLASD